MFLYLMEGVRSMANATLRYQEFRSQKFRVKKKAE
jgi:hypothetical protein